MKHLYLFSLLVFFNMSAQVESPQGACSVSLVSSEETVQQFTCTETLQPIIPIVFAITASNYSITGLPPGITATFDAGMLTISGTPTSFGLWYYEIETSEGCNSGIHGLGFSQISDPDLTCSNITSSSITFNWTSLADQQDGTLFVSWIAGDLFDIQTYFLPTDVSSMTADGLPPNTEVTFQFDLESGVPLCFPASYITCTTANLGSDEFAGRRYNFTPNPTSGILNFSGNETVDEILFYDLAGRKVKHFASPQSRIDISALSPAMYLMKVVANGKVESFRIMKN